MQGTPKGCEGCEGLARAFCLASGDPGSSTRMGPEASQHRSNTRNGCALPLPPQPTRLRPRLCSHLFRTFLNTFFSPCCSRHARAQMPSSCAACGIRTHFPLSPVSLRGELEKQPLQPPRATMRNQLLKFRQPCGLLSQQLLFLPQKPFQAVCRRLIIHPVH